VGPSSSVFKRRTDCIQKAPKGDHHFSSLDIVSLFGFFFPRLFLSSLHPSDPFRFDPARLQASECGTLFRAHFVTWLIAINTLIEISAKYSLQPHPLPQTTHRIFLAIENMFGVVRSCHGYMLTKGKTRPIISSSHSIPLGQ
jgi:hypothetical protein